MDHHDACNGTHLPFWADDAAPVTRLNTVTVDAGEIDFCGAAISLSFHLSKDHGFFTKRPSAIIVTKT